MRKTADTEFMILVRSIVAGDSAKVREIVGASPGLVRTPAVIGASRQSSLDYFFPEIRHYLYGGDTALHMAAAAFRFELAQFLIDHGASCAAKNRRGAEPLHYASDCNRWSPDAQVATIQCLLRSGANPNATDKSGVAPIHRAVRTRCAAAVEALLSGGAKVDLRNKSGSTPLHLAVQNTGRGGSCSPEAIEQQRQIIRVLLDSGASIKEKDDSGKTVDRAATGDWIRQMLHSQR